MHSDINQTRRELDLESLEDVRLPQTFVDRERPLQVPTSAKLAYALEELEDKVRKAIIEVMQAHGLSRKTSEIVRMPLIQSVGPLADVRNMTGFRLADYASADNGNNEAVDIVSVEIRRIPGQRDKIVPLIHPHIYPKFDLGDEVRHQIYREYEREFGEQPPDLIRSKFEKGWQHFLTWLHEHKSAMVAMFALAGAVGSGYFYRSEIKTGFDNIQLHYEQVQKQKAEEVRLAAIQKQEAAHKADIEDRAARAQKVSRVLAAIDAAQDKNLFSSILNPISTQDFDALARQFTDQSVAQSDRLTALQTFGRLGGLMRAYHPAQFDSDDALLSGVPRPAMLKHVTEALKDKSVEIRHTAADVYREIEIAR